MSFCIVSLKLLWLKIASNHIDVCVGDVYVHVDTFVAVAADVDVDADVDADLSSMGQNAHQRDESMALNKLPAKSC